MITRSEPVYGTLDVDSLFTNLPLDETMCVIAIKDSDVVNGLTKEDVHKLLNIATKESFLCLNIVITNKRMVWPWHPRLGPWSTFSFATMRSCD